MNLSIFSVNSMHINCCLNADHKISKLKEVSLKKQKIMSCFLVKFRRKLELSTSLQLLTIWPPGPALTCYCCCLTSGQLHRPAASQQQSGGARALASLSVVTMLQCSDPRPGGSVNTPGIMSRTFRRFFRSWSNARYKVKMTLLRIEAHNVPMYHQTRTEVPGPGGVTDSCQASALCTPLFSVNWQNPTSARSKIKIRPHVETLSRPFWSEEALIFEMIWGSEVFTSFLYMTVDT